MRVTKRTGNRRIRRTSDVAIGVERRTLEGTTRDRSTSSRRRGERTDGITRRAEATIAT